MQRKEKLAKIKFSPFYMIKIVIILQSIIEYFSLRSTFFLACLSIVLKANTVHPMFCYVGYHIVSFLALL